MSMRFLKGDVMRHYSEHDLQSVRSTLQHSLDSLLERIRAGLSESEQLQFTAILGRSTGDSSDEALATTLGDLSAARLDLEMRQWRELKAAEQRLDDADYGACPDCGNIIPVARLLANPAALRCTDCQSVFERTHADHPHASL